MKTQRLRTSALLPTNKDKTAQHHEKACVCIRPDLRQARNLPPHQRLPDWLSSMGLIRAEIASRARKIRERTVPMGQAMAWAMSS